MAQMIYSRFVSLLFANFLLFLCFTACSHTVYVYTPLPGVGAPVPIQVSEDPIGTANVTLKPQKKILIVIDPGHGGKDLGTHSRKPPYQEKYLTLTTAYMLRNYLNQFGYEAVLTRKNDVFIALDKRSEFANERNPRLFVSIHFNSAPNKQAEGLEIFYYKAGKDKNRIKQSKKLANLINKNMISQTGAKSRGVKAGDLAVIRETNMPAVLVEGGFLTNEGEMTKLKSAVYLKKLALGMAQGIKEYLAQDPLTEK